MDCLSCGTEKLSPSRVYRYEFSICGLDRVYLNNWRAYVCSECNDEYPILPNAEQVTKFIAAKLLQKQFTLTGDEVLFLRKAVGLSLETLAGRLTSVEERILSWESGETLDIASDHNFRRFIALELFEDRAHYFLLEKIFFSSEPNPLEIEIDPDALSEFVESLKPLT